MMMKVTIVMMDEDEAIGEHDMVMDFWIYLHISYVTNQINKIAWDFFTKTWQI